MANNEDAASVAQSISQAAVSGGLGAGMGLELDDAYFDIPDFMADQTVSAANLPISSVVCRGHH